MLRSSKHPTEHLWCSFSPFEAYLGAALSLLCCSRPKMYRHHQKLITNYPLDFQQASKGGF